MVIDPAWLKLLVDSLPPVERQVVNGLFYECRTLRVVAKDVGVSVRTVRRIRQRALAHLKKAAEAMG